MKRYGSKEEPSIDTVGPPEPRFRFPRGTGRQDRTPDPQQSGKVLAENRRLPAPACLLDRKPRVLAPALIHQVDVTIRQSAPDQPGNGINGESELLLGGLDPAKGRLQRLLRAPQGSDVRHRPHVFEDVRDITGGARADVQMLDGAVVQQEPVLEVEWFAVPRGAPQRALNEGDVVRVYPREHHVERWLGSTIEANQLVGFLRPEQLSSRDVPAEAAGEAQPLRLGQVGFAAAERLVRPRQLPGPFSDQSLQIVMSTMERLLRLPAHGDLAFQCHVLPGELLEHAVDGSGQRVQLVRSAAHGDTTGEIAFDDGGRGAADLTDLEEERTAYDPPDRGTQHDHGADGGGDSIPEE